MSTDNLPVSSPDIAVPAAAPVVNFNQKPRPKVYIAASAYDWKCETNFANAFLDSVERCHCQLSIDWGSGDAAIGRKRNFQMWRFLKKSDADFIFFIDSDIVWSPVDLDRIVSHNLPICGGIYPKKSYKLDGCYNLWPNSITDDRGLVDVKHAGNGFLCISRSAAERFIAYHGAKIEYRGDPDPELRWDFFPFGAKDMAYKSEDWYFCERAREAGICTRIDTTVQVRHIGKVVFPIFQSITDEEVVDLLYHKYDGDRNAVRNFLLTLPKKPIALDKPNT